MPFNGSTRNYKQICNTHLALCEYVSLIKLPGILELDSESGVRITDENGKILKAVMSLCSILMEIEVPSLRKPLFLMIAGMRDSKFEWRVISTWLVQRHLPAGAGITIEIFTWSRTFLLELL